MVDNLTVFCYNGYRGIVMKITKDVKKDLLDLGISENTLNVFDANCDDLALEMLKLYAGLKKDKALDTLETRQTLIDTYVKMNPTVQYIKKDTVLEPEIVDYPAEDLDFPPHPEDAELIGEDIIHQLEYMNSLDAEKLKKYLVEEILDADLEIITEGEFTREQIEFMTPKRVLEEMEKYFDYWEDVIYPNYPTKDVEENLEINPLYKEPELEDDLKAPEDFSYLPHMQRNWFKQTPEDRFNNGIQSDVRYVMDYVSNPKTSRGLGGEIGNETFEDLESASANWHRSLWQIERIRLIPTNKGDDTVSDIDTEETNEIMINYRQGGKGYYWANLNEHFSAQEQRRMSHCGKCMHTLYSFRSTLDATVTGIPNHEDVLDRTELFSDGKPEGHTVTRSHFTVSMGNDGVIYQMKAAQNEKVPAEFHKYVVDLLMAKNLPILGGTLPQIKGFGFEYDNGNDFTLAQIQDKVLVDKLYKARKDLFTEGFRNISDKEMETFMIRFGLQYEGPAKENTPKFKFWEKPKDYIMTEREKKEEEERVKLREKWKTSPRPNLWDHNIKDFESDEDELAKEPEEKSWFKDDIGWKKAEYVYILKSGEERKFPCKYDPFLNIFTDVDDDELYTEIENGDIKEEYILYKNKRIKDGKLEI